MHLAPLLVVSALGIAGHLQAQVGASEGEVFLAAEIDTPPHLMASLRRYHPKDHLERSARVRVQFVVDTVGLADPGAIRISDAPDSTFDAAARMTILAREYLPGSTRGLKVRVLMEETMRLRGKDVRCDYLIQAYNVALCADSLTSGR
jgi:hypothetical protein